MNPGPKVKDSLRTSKFRVRVRVKAYFFTGSLPRDSKTPELRNIALNLIRVPIAI